jgi:uncharacterized protein YecE (DUF72 family)
MKRLRLGCSGWDYEEWNGTLYFKGGGSKLAAYTSVFDTAEINSTFYRMPTEGMVLGWLRHTPDDFVFTAKVPQTVTHDKWMELGRGAKDDLDAYLKVMAPLNDAGKLRCLLLQLRPKMTFEPKTLRPFLEALDPAFRFALEPRNHSWLVPEALEVLKEFKVAYTIVDEPLLPPDAHITADFAYIRWHGRGKATWYDYRYSHEQLLAWVPKVQEALNGGKEVWGYFNNHFHGNAPENCLEILEMLGALTEKQKAFLESRKRAGKARTLDDF